MAAIAVGRVARALTRAEVGSTVGFRCERLGREIGANVLTVAEWLIARPTAGTPVVFLSSRQVSNCRLVVGNGRVGRVL